jgi:hypothetical protein
MRKTLILTLIALASNVQAATTVKTDKNVYDCSDKITLSLTVNDFNRDKGKIQVRWKRPSGRTQDYASFEVIPSEGIVRATSWLSLSRATGTTVLSAFDPSIGYSDFIGQWTAVVTLNGSDVGKTNFIVDC